MKTPDEKKQGPPNLNTHFINGPTSFLEDSTCSYNVVPDNGLSYLWTVTGGTITTGQGTDTVTVAWSSTTGVITASVISDITVLDTSAGTW